jgi:UDP-glucose 4-epimerase
MLELIAEMEALSSSKLMLKTSEPAAGDVKLTIADTRIQNNLLGFAPSTSLHDGLEKFMHWHSRGN